MFHFIIQPIEQLFGNIAFADAKWLLLSLAVIPALFFASSRRKTLGHSQVGIHDNLRSMPFIGRLPSLAMVTLIIGMALTLAQPELVKATQYIIQLSRDFVITVDVSGSMSEALKVAEQKDFVLKNAPAATSPAAPGAMTPAATTADATPAPAAADAKPPTKAQASREAIRQFLLRRKGDRIALITFDDRCYVDEPLGLNLRSVMNKLDEILYSGGGTNFDGLGDGNSETGGIKCSIDHFIKMSKSTSRVFIMETDGEDNIDPQRAQILAKLIKEQHIRMYVLGVGDSWTGDKVPDLQKFVESVGGRVIRVGNLAQMQEGFKLIDEIEKTETTVATTEDRVPLYPWFAAGTFCILIFMFAFSAFVREDV
ncbi:MAG: VWA domain-containing protein [Candidatus Obscuribacterales bacterium]|nr:VWA domain-containing protein [Candidatus Obscuribacterales bacterium]